MNADEKSTFLLHCCCASCSTYPLQILKKHFDLTVFFYNPNIHPQEEHALRKREMERLSNKWMFPYLAGSYDIDHWFSHIRGFETEPERGHRCEICYRLRLEETARLAKERGIAVFGTTLSISPHKNAETINRIGKAIEKKWGVRYYEADFKKKDGFKISCQISREEHLIRQNYCGCVHSRPKDEKDGERI
ncbi:epoxyqueuosine reductase QueH [bacterium]|nr:epoxyqueuosine reductase QueH [bacterium]